MAEMDESIRVSLNLEVKDPNVDLKSLDEVTKYLDEIYNASKKVNDAMKEALDSGSVNSDALKAYEEHINTIKSAFEAVAQAKDAAITNSFDEFAEAGDDVDYTDESVEQLNIDLEDTSSLVEDLTAKFKKLGDVKVTAKAPDLSNVKKQVSEGAKVTTKAPSMSDVSGITKQASKVESSDIDLSSLDKLAAYLDKITDDSIKAGEAMKKAFDMGSVNPDTLKVYKEQVASIKKAFEEVKRIKAEATDSAYDFADFGDKASLDALNGALDKLDRNLETTDTWVKEVDAQFKRLKVNADISNLAPDLTSSKDTQKQMEQVAQATNKVASSTSKTVSASAKVCANTVNKALHTIGNVGEKVFTKIGKAGLATFKTIATGMTNALVHPISNLKKLESVLLKPFKSLNSLLPQVSMGIRGVTSGLLALGGVAGLLMLGKQAVTTSSQLEEIQNVVDVVFNEMSSDIEDFSTRMAGAFGESELQAKHFTSVFGAMFDSVQIASDKVLVMSKNMAALTGDLASFYNIPLDDAFHKIQSGLVGETEPLRQLGINMTQASIEAWAMTQGITTSFQKLSTSEQTILRYNYLLAMTANAHGDFTRTQLSWANSCRQIALNVQTIFAALGNIVKAALTPVLTMINYVTSALARLLTLVGARFKSTTQTASSGMSDLNSQISDASDGLGKVADSATKAGKAAEAAGKKAKLGLASFDQLNNLSSQPSDAGSSGGSGAGGGAGAGANAGMDINPNSYIEGIEWSDDNPLTQWMNKFYETLTDGRYAKAGEMCSKAITTGLKKVEKALDDKDLYAKIDNTNMALSNFLRGLVSDQNMWTQLGNTIGSGINLIAFSINNLYANLTANSVLSSFGQGIANTINASLEKTDWASVGMALTTGIRSGIDVAFYAIMNIDFTSLGTALKNGCSGAISRVFGEGGAAEIGGIIAGSLNGAFDTVVAWLGDGTVATKLGEGIKTSINTAINNLDVESMGSALTAMLSSAADIMAELRGIDFNKLFNKIVESINTAIENGSAEDFLTSAIGLVGDILSAMINALPQIDWGKLIKELKNAISKTIDEHPELADIGLKFLAALGIAKALQGIDLGSMLNTSKLSSSLDGVSKSLDKLGETKALSSLGSSLASASGEAGGLSGALAGAEGSAGGLGGAIGGLGGAIGGLLGPIAIVAAAVGAFIGTFVYLWNTSSTFREEINKIKDKLEKDLKPVMNDMKESLKQIGDFLLKAWDVVANLLEPFIVAITAALADLFEGMMKIVGGIVDIVAGILTLDPDKIMEGLGKILDGLNDLLSAIGDGVVAFFDDIWKKITKFIDDNKTKIEDFFTGIWDKITKFVEDTKTNIGDFFKGIWDKIVKFVTDTIDKIATFFSDLWTKFTNGMSTIGDKVSTGISNVVKFFADLPGKVKEKVDDFVSKVKTWFGKVPDNIKEAFKDVASIGKNLVEGIWNGINDKVDWIVKKVQGFGDKVMKGLKDFFGIHSPSRLMRDEIGIYLGEGIGVGIEDSAKYAVASATQMGSDVMSAVADSVDPDALKFADMKLSLADVYKTDNLDTVLQNYNTQMDSLVSKAQAFRDAMNEVSGKYSLDTLKVLLGDYRKVNSGDDFAPQRVIISGQDQVIAVSGMSEGVSANEVMGIVNDNARRF
jgi:phage-related protein